MALKRKSRKRWLWLALFALALGSLTVWRVYFFNDAPRGGPPMGLEAPPVRVAKAVSQEVPQYLNGLGTVLPSSDVLVQSRVDGQLMRLHFRDGQRVAAGDLLAEIDPRPFQAALDQARGNLRRDKAQLENAKRDLARYEKLAKGDFIAEQQYENQKALVRQYQGVVEADQAAVDSAKLQLDYSRVTAPVSGRLGLRAVDEGNQVKANDGKGIVRITETDPSDVIFTLPENQVGLATRALRESERDPETPLPLVEAWDRENKNRLAAGELLSIDNQIDTATGTVRLKARFPNETDSLFPNQFVNARLLARTIPDAVTVPAAAVQLGANGSYCYVITEDEDGPKVSYREVAPGLIANGAQIIEKGISPGETVVVDGVDRLRDGAKARVAATIETPNAAAAR